jgi:SAM-dependent methyltransferase
MNPDSPSNIDTLTVQDFGEEWHAFDQSDFPEAEARTVFDAYFEPFRWDLVDSSSVGFDMGCGSASWAKLLSPRDGHLHCIDPSAALDVAKRNLTDLTNISFLDAAADPAPLLPASMDFGISLGVLHHVPDPTAAIKSCAAMLKPGAPLLLYPHYRFDNQPHWYRLLWEASELGRRVISRLPRGLRIAMTSLIAALVYWPLAHLARVCTALDLNVNSLPLTATRASTPCAQTRWTALAPGWSDASPTRRSPAC